MKNRANNLLLPAVFAAAFSAAVAQANCDAVINALEKAQAQPRLAQYSVDSREQPLTGQPMLVRIGTAEYTSYEVGGQFSHFERQGHSGITPLISALKRAAKEGIAHCESAGSEAYRGTTAHKFRFDNPAAPKTLNPTTIWIAQATGLPLYHEMHGLDGGFVWVFGDAVKEPVVQK